MNPVIADTTLFARRPGGERFELRIRTGTPYRIDPDEWACPVAADPRYELGDIRSSDSLQAFVPCTLGRARLATEVQGKRWLVVQFGLEGVPAGGAWVYREKMRNKN